MNTRADRTRELKLKDAVQRLHDAIGSHEAAAEFSGKKKSVHSSYGNPNEPTHMPIDVVARLERVAGDPVVTRELAALAHKMLVDIPDTPVGGSWAEVVGLFTKEVAEAMSHVNGAYAKGGVITAEEIIENDLIREVEEGIEKMFKMVFIFRALTEGGE